MNSIAFNKMCIRDRALGGRTTDKNLALAMVDEWLDTQFEGGRHQRRVDMLDKL